MNTPQVKIIVGFRREQHVTIDASEAPKAYYLFLNPEKRGVFNNGVALRGVDIQGIVPDLHATMGWNPEYVITPDDHNEIRETGIERKIKAMLTTAKEIAQSGIMSEIEAPLEVPKMPLKIIGNNPITDMRQKLIDSKRMMPRA